MSWVDEADPMTSSALVAVGQYGESAERQMAALRTAINILRAVDELETQLREKGKYAITPDTMIKVRD